jgi:hypothetical protein
MLADWLSTWQEQPEPGHHQASVQTQLLIHQRGGVGWVEQRETHRNERRLPRKSIELRTLVFTSKSFVQTLLSAGRKQTWI